MAGKTKSLIIITLLAITLFTVGCLDEAQSVTEEVPGTEPVVEETPVSEESEDETAAPELVGTTWQWIRFDDMGEINNLDVEYPASYTLLLDADGIYHLKADCNQVSGGYTLDGASLSFEPGLTTLAECGEESHYTKFLTYIDNVATYVMDEDTLYLNLWADGGNMVFVPFE